MMRTLVIPGRTRTRAAEQRPRRDDGASLVEYALLVALIAIVSIAAVAFFGGATSSTFSEVGRSFSQS